MCNILREEPRKYWREMSELLVKANEAMFETTAVQPVNTGSRKDFVVCSSAVLNILICTADLVLGSCACNAEQQTACDRSQPLHLKHHAV